MNIVFLKTTASYGHLFNATNKKTQLLAKGLTACGDRVTIHNGIEGIIGITEEERYDEAGTGNVISYPHRKIRILEPIANYNKLRRDLKSIYVPGEKNLIILLSPYYHIYLEYQLIARTLGYKIAVISHEWLPTLNHPTILHRALRKIYSKLFGYGVDAILPISDYIIEKVSHFDKPILKTPVLGEFPPIDSIGNHSSGFVYCGSIDYERAFMTLVDAYEIYVSKNKDPYPLTLVLSGRQDRIAETRSKISKQNHGKINIVSGISYTELYNLYKAAVALLLPLDPENIQDRARFSQKIAEYVATGTPMITNPVGEICNYFSDRKSAIINQFSPEGFAESMEWIATHTDEGIRIGREGWNIGNREFNYLTFGERLHSFLESI